MKIGRKKKEIGLSKKKGLKKEEIGLLKKRGNRQIGL